MFRYLASGSGDKTVRFWDLTTETPHHTCKGHVSWVLAILCLAVSVPHIPGAGDLVEP